MAAPGELLELITSQTWVRLHRGHPCRRIHCSCSSTPHPIIEFYDENLSRKEWLGGAGRDAPQGVGQSIDANHRFNSLLWDEEERARRLDVGPADIAPSKCLIDRHNQQRNDAVEAIDEVIFAQLDGIRVAAQARLSSETAGAMIDRLSILLLKIFHMREQTRRADAGVAHVDTCRAELQRLSAQPQDLAGCLDLLLAEAHRGQAYFKVYHQFKMYNEPSLNPYLYGMAATGPAQ